MSTTHPVDIAIAPVDQAHDLADIVLFCTDQYMIMVRHETVRQHPERNEVIGKVACPQQFLHVVGVFEDVAPIVASQDAVIETVVVKIASSVHG